MSTVFVSSAPDHDLQLQGLTLRQALRALRRENWGETGTMSPVMLSDGSALSVCNAPTDDGRGILPSVHVALREWPKTGECRSYKLTQ